MQAPWDATQEGIHLRSCFCADLVTAQMSFHAGKEVEGLGLCFFFGGGSIPGIFSLFYLICHIVFTEQLLFLEAKQTCAPRATRLEGELRGGLFCRNLGRERQRAKSSATWRSPGSRSWRTWCSDGAWATGSEDCLRSEARSSRTPGAGGCAFLCEARTALTPRTDAMDPLLAQSRTRRHVAEPRPRDVWGGRRRRKPATGIAGTTWAWPSGRRSPALSADVAAQQ